MFIFCSGPPETDHLTPVTENAPFPRRDGERAEGKDGERRQGEWSLETGRDPPPRTWPRAGNERDPSHSREIDTPALKRESLGRYEGEKRSKDWIWIYCLVEGAG